MNDRKDYQREWKRNWRSKNRGEDRKVHRRWYWKNPQRAREQAKLRREKNPEKFRTSCKKCYWKDVEKTREKNNVRLRNLRIAVSVKFGNKCSIVGCQANKYPEEIRVLGLELHHLNGAERENGKRIHPVTEYRRILAGEEKEVQLLCAFHHAIADAIGIEKWLEFVNLSNANPKALMVIKNE